MSTRINLLPWREMRQRQQDRQVLTIAVAAWIAMGLVVVFMYVTVTAWIETQNEKNRYLETEIAKVEQEIKEIQELRKKKTDLEARMNIILQLQTDRTGMVRMFDEMVRRLPEGVYLTSLKTTGLGVSVQGVAQSNARVSTFMRNLDGSNWFANPELDVINVKPRGGERLSEFSLRVKRVNKQKPDAVGATSEVDS